MLLQIKERSKKILDKENTDAHESYSSSKLKEEWEETSNDIDQLKEKQVVTQFELSKKEDQEETSNHIDQGHLNIAPTPTLEQKFHRLTPYIPPHRRYGLEITRKDKNQHDGILFNKYVFELLNGDFF